MTTVPNEVWRKSSFSGQDSDCVEVSNRGRVRDSKHPTGPQLRGAAGLLAAVKAHTPTKR